MSQLYQCGGSLSL